MKQIIVDSSYLCHKARFSTNKLKSNDINTGVIFGFFIQILNVAEIFESNDFLFTWDSKKSLRKKIFPEYKKKRYSKPMTDEELEALRAAFHQMNVLRMQILPNLGFKNNFHCTGLEGDDLIAQLCIQCEQQGEEVIIIASDKDLYQLLTNNVSMFSDHKHYKLKNFEEEWGICPEAWKRVKAIGGCVSDEIPGIPRVGEKTVCKYLRGELKETTKAYQAITDESNEELIQRNHKLVDLPFPRTKELTIQEDELSITKFRRLCIDYEFKSFLKTRWDEIFRLFNGNYRKRYK